jgi:hypothetical protein
MKSTTIRALAAAALTAFLTVPAFAGSVSFTFTKPENTSDSKVTVNVYKGDTKVGGATAIITPGMTAEQKRDAIKAALEAEGFTVTSTGTPPADPGITISGLTDGRKVFFNPGSTGEKRDSETAKLAAFSSISFEDGFLSTDSEGEPAVFTAGLHTDLGSAVVSYQASDFPPGAVIPGAFIARRLFSELQPAAADLGAALSLEGHTIAVRFAPDLTRRGGGVTFGTTSPGEGLSGGGTVGEEE